MERTLIILLMVTLLTVGCSSTETVSNDPEPVDDGQSQESRSNTEVEKQTDPLTGLAVDDGGIHHPVVMVMINNHPKARPQTGLNRADIVFEVLAEGEITRFAAFYHSVTEGNIGPVRSARPYYLDLAEGFDAVVAHAGGSPAAKERFSQPGYPSIDGIGEDGKYFTREDFRQAPHNLYTSMERLLQGAAEQGFGDQDTFPSLLFSDSSADIVGDETAKDIHIEYGPLYNVGYRYDSAMEQFTRFTQGELHIDRETEQPLAIDNILVIKVPHQVLDDQGRRDIELDGSGEGWLFQQGFVQKVDWKYENGFTRPYKDGQEIPLIPGKTWVNVIPLDAEIHYK